MIKYYSYPQYNDSRYGFVLPFILGGITGGLAAPYFYQPNYIPNNVNYQNKYMVYSNNPYYYR